MLKLLIPIFLFLDFSSFIFCRSGGQELTEDEAKIVAMFGNVLKKYGVETREEEKSFVGDFIKEKLNGKIGAHSEGEIRQKFNEYLEKEKGILLFWKMLKENEITTRNNKELIQQIYLDLMKKHQEKWAKEGKRGKASETLEEILGDEKLVREVVGENMAIKKIQTQLAELFREFENTPKIGTKIKMFEKKVMAYEILKKLKAQGKLDDLKGIEGKDVRGAFLEEIGMLTKLATFFVKFLDKNGGIDKKEEERIWREFEAKLGEEGKIDALHSVNEPVLGEVLSRVLKEHKNEANVDGGLNIAKFFGGKLSTDHRTKPKPVVKAKYGNHGNGHGDGGHA